MFEKTLNDLIRGLRANKGNEPAYIRHAVQECRREAASQDGDVKAGALLKLAYLNMFGQEMDWAAFQTVEVMASPKFVNKRIGYMAASQGFSQSTDVLMLATNLIKKDVLAANTAEVCLALGGLADIVTPDLARDIAQDVARLLNHSRPLVRRKAILTLYKIYLRYPEALRSSYARLCEMLEDEDPSVVSASINLITELSRKNSKNYLSLAPTLFQLLTTSSNNWMLIKIVKLFATMLPLEPRLVKKLIQPLTDLIQSTQAMSLLYECINTVVSSELLTHPNGDYLARLCISKLRTFFGSGDQNLKYVALMAFTKVMVAKPELVLPCHDLIMDCIDDGDDSVRMRALELVSYMPTRDTLPDIVRRLMLQLLPSSKLALADGQRAHIVRRVLGMCSKDTYALVDDFDWYVAVLVDLVKIARVDVAEELRDEIRNVCVRVESVREFAIPLLATLVVDRERVERVGEKETNGKALAAGAWCVGEFGAHVEDTKAVLDKLLGLPLLKADAEVQQGYISAMIKLYVRWTKELHHFEPETKATALLTTRVMAAFVKALEAASDAETQRRAIELSAVLEVALQALDEHEGEAAPAMFSEILPAMYLGDGELKPVGANAQRHLPPPGDLDLDAWIRPPTPLPTPPPAIEPATEDPALVDAAEPTEAERVARRKARSERNKDDPFYLGSTATPPPDEHLLSGDAAPDSAEHERDSADASAPIAKRKKRRPKINEPVVILADDVPEGMSAQATSLQAPVPTKSAKTGKNVLRFDEGGLASFDLSKVDDDETNYDDVVEQAKAAAAAERAIAAPSEASHETTRIKDKKDKKQKSDRSAEARKKKDKKKRAKDAAAELQPVQAAEDVSSLIDADTAAPQATTLDGYADLNDLPQDDSELEVVRKPKKKRAKDKDKARSGDAAV